MAAIARENMNVSLDRKPSSTHGSTMRPDILNRYFTPLSALEGIGTKTAKLFARLLGLPESQEPRLIRLITHIPNGVIDRRNMPEIAFAAEGEMVTLKVRVDRHQPSPQGRPNIPHRVFCHDETGEIGLAYFRAKGTWLERQFTVDDGAPGSCGEPC
jgi:ATP-dependent DNA helicase RecG